MIDSKSFRLGNIVDCFGICEIIEIKQDKIKVRRPSDSKTKFLIEKVPITSLSLNVVPLTKKWVEEFEDQLNDFGFLYRHSIITNRVFFYFGNTTIICDYLHQLQNIYFEITGKELKT